MKAIDQAQLAQHLDQRDQKKYSRLLLNRFFQATVTFVDDTVTPNLVQVQRVGESAPDGNTYSTGMVPNYVPKAGDNVDVMWRDDGTGYVAAVLTSTIPPTSASLLSLFGSGGSVVGTPDFAQPFKVQAVAGSYTSNGAGDASVSFTTAFPTALLLVHAQPFALSVAGLTAVTSVSPHDFTLSGFQMRYYSGTAPQASLNVPVSWIALGQ